MAFAVVRPGELRPMQWREIDVESAVRSIPPERTKMQRPHKVPMARQALAALDEVRPSPDQVIASSRPALE
ncbi:hypothetical protein KHC23_12285 [Ancylobacter dichloromethanicus]|uniref:hypothetical protein n=1 Tax=Ancylobacter dichloromethanicus TaxID=518825 RepID=UPI001BCE78DB|nr:hypothetical protein [Ancylobacter dichloromethanicus]MBS7554432.1 hypothetical protein [Ancylobacter dichloromethanicus]